MERWLNAQIGWRGLLARLEHEAPRYAQLLPELPRLLHQALLPREPAHRQLFTELLAEQQRTSRLLQGLVYFVAGGAVGALLVLAVTGRRLF
jgi:ubiquinone biosynthesis protein